MLEKNSLERCPILNSAFYQWQDTFRIEPPASQLHSRPRPPLSDPHEDAKVALLWQKTTHVEIAGNRRSIEFEVYHANRIGMFRVEFGLGTTYELTEYRQVLFQVEIHWLKYVVLG